MQFIMILHWYCNCACPSLSTVLSIRTCKILWIFADEHVPVGDRHWRGADLRHLHLRVDGLDHAHRGEHNLKGQCQAFNRIPSYRSKNLFCCCCTTACCFTVLLLKQNEPLKYYNKKYVIAKRRTNCVTSFTEQ